MTVDKVTDSTLCVCGHERREHIDGGLCIRDESCGCCGFYPADWCPICQRIGACEPGCVNEEVA